MTKTKRSCEIIPSPQRLTPSKPRKRARRVKSCYEGDFIRPSLLSHHSVSTWKRPPPDWKHPNTTLTHGLHFIMAIQDAASELPRNMFKWCKESTGSRLYPTASTSGHASLSRRARIARPHTGPRLPPRERHSESGHLHTNLCRKTPYTFPCVGPGCWK